MDEATLWESEEAVPGGAQRPPRSNVRDKTGQRFGRLTVVRLAGMKTLKNGARLANWLCRCDCGNEIEVDTNHLQRKGTSGRGCGCGPGFKDKTGERFGKLVVIKYLGSKARDHGTKVAVWLCQCDCGNAIELDTARLWRRTSCGCFLTYKDKTGQRFGTLVVIKHVGTRRYGSRNQSAQAQWLCRCDCGKEVVVTSSHLDSRKGCGCGRRRPRPNQKSRWNYAQGQAAKNSVVKQYRHSAKHRGLECTLTEAELEVLVTADCHYCGCPPSIVRHGPGRNSGEFVFNGIDRMDSSLGYVPGNVVTCCITCNRAKHVMPYAEFIAWLGRLVAFRNQLQPVPARRRGRRSAAGSPELPFPLSDSA